MIMMMVTMVRMIVTMIMLTYENGYANFLKGANQFVMRANCIALTPHSTGPIIYIIGLSEIGAEGQ